MEEIVARARPFYWLQGGLHSTETGSPEMLMELAYRLAVSDEPRDRATSASTLIVLINPVRRARRPRPRRGLVLPAPQGEDRLREPARRSIHRTGASTSGHDNNRDLIQRKLALTRASEDAFLKWHPDRLPRPARVHPPALDLDGHRPLQRESRPDHDDRVARDRVPRGDGDDGARDAGRLDVGLRRGLLADLRGFRRDEPQCDRPRLRDLRERDGRDGRARPRAGRGGVHGQARHRARLVPRAAAAEEVPMVAPRQHELHGDRRPCGARLRGVERILDDAQLLAARAQRGAERGNREALRDRDSRDAAGPRPARGGGRPAAGARHRGRAREGGVHALPRAASPRARSSSGWTSRIAAMRSTCSRAQKYPAEKALYPPYDDVAWALPSDVRRRGETDRRRGGPNRRGRSGHRRPWRFPGRVEGKGPVYLLADTGQDALLEARVRLAGVSDRGGGKGVLLRRPRLSRRDPGSSLRSRGFGPALEKIAADLGLDFRSAPAAPARRRATSSTFRASPCCRPGTTRSRRAGSA